MVALAMAATTWRVLTFLSCQRAAMNDALIHDAQENCQAQPSRVQEENFGRAGRKMLSTELGPIRGVGPSLAETLRLPIKPGRSRAWPSA